MRCRNSRRWRLNSGQCFPPVSSCGSLGTLSRYVFRPYRNGISTDSNGVLYLVVAVFLTDNYFAERYGGQTSFLRCCGCQFNGNDMAEYILTQVADKLQIVSVLKMIYVPVTAGPVFVSLALHSWAIPCQDTQTSLGI